MEINTLLKKGVEILGNRKYSEPVLEVVFLLCNLLGVDETYIYTYGEKEVPKSIEKEFLEKITLRKKGYPLQYILNEVEFMGLKFYVNEGVLIPRQDTEILVEYILNIMDEKKEYTIVELGTGSGCICLSLANYFKGKVSIYGVDINDEALIVAEKNLEDLNLKNKVKLLKGDLFKGIESLHLEEKVDIIVSNPPYIPSETIENLQEEVKKYEPIEALDGGKDGLYFYRRIIPESKKYLNKTGILTLEIGYDQGEKVSTIFETEGYENIEIIKDLQGHDRVVVGQMPKEGENAF